ncbi:hypothetical protein BDW22DRAFT_1324567 [Trametopsis cervina]|nr:hypothetical protein BDW22DRAFT_1324567 [Trametopsis cervina]
MSVFEPNKSLLNPKFEGYKLDAIDQDAVLTRFKLEHPLTQSSAAGKSPLSFQEVQSRIRHNHIAVGPDGVAAYVDSDMKVVKITWDQTDPHPKFETIYEIPTSLQSDETDTLHREYPSVVFADATTLLVSDGNGALYVLKLGETGQATLFNSYELKVSEVYFPSFPYIPFRIHLARHDSEDSLVALLSSKTYDVPSEEASAYSRKKKDSKYDVWAVRVDLAQVSQDLPLPLEIKWHRRGEDVPAYAAYVDSRDVFLLVGSSPYIPLAAPAQPNYEPAADEIAPIPRADENIDTAVQSTNSPPQPPPYSWAQSTDSVTVAFALPSDTPKNAIRVTLSPTTLTVLVQPNPSSPGIVPLPYYPHKKMWDGIRTSTSFWTFDREAEHTYGLLTLHLDKQHDGTRWMQVFAQTEGEPDVPEMLDPSELYAIRESLEKYTAALQTGEDASGLGLGRGVPSLAEGEMDDEVDLDMGDAVVATWVAADGATPAWAGKGADAPFSMLSTPLPGVVGEPPSVVAKNGLDGLVYALDTPEGNPDAVAWKHTGTFCVLSFVLASKRDTRFVHHISSRTVVAFESGARGLGSNLYLYRSTARSGDKQAKQAVLKVGDVSSGPLLGVGMLKTRAGETVTLCLCERELAVIRNTL